MLTGLWEGMEVRGIGELVDNYILDMGCGYVTKKERIEKVAVWFESMKQGGEQNGTAYASTDNEPRKVNKGAKE